MMMSSRLIIFALLAIVTCISQADGVSTTCSGLALDAEGLQQTECSTKDGLTVVRYHGPAPSSVYATEFDRRAVTVASGVNARIVREAAGITSGARGMSIGRSRLVKPPVEAQIVHRTTAKKTQKHLHWTILVEEMQYGAQGDAPGFVIDCATALRSNRYGTIAVAECFPLEERQRFLRTLRAIK